MIEVKVFQSGNSQAIRLPKKYRLTSSTVQINKIGKLLVIIPQDDPWGNFKEGIKDATNFPVKNDSGLKLKKVSL